MVAYRKKNKRRRKIESCAKKFIGRIHAMSINRPAGKRNGPPKSDRPSLIIYLNDMYRDMQYYHTM
jgi:hypothetical protein